MNVSAISAADVGKLRAATGAGLMDCKKALTETSGDFDKAVDWLRKKGIAKAASKESREIKAGAVFGWTDDAQRVGVLLELGCETDFVARNEQFQAAGKQLLDLIAQENPAPGEILERRLGAGGTVKETLQQLTAKIGENIQLGRFARFQVDGTGAVYSYLHYTGTVGVLVEVSAASDDVARHEATKEAAKDVCLHIAAMKPIALTREQVPADVVAREREVQSQSDALKGKPENMVAKIVDGKMEAFFKERCLLDQPFVKDDKKSVREIVKGVAAKAGGTVELKRFALFSVGGK